MGDPPYGRRRPFSGASPSTRTATARIDTCGPPGCAPDRIAVRSRLAGSALCVLPLPRRPTSPRRSIAGAGREGGAGITDREEILAVAWAHDATAAQVRLAWTPHQGPHVLAIPGTGNPDHLIANVAAGALRFAWHELDRLKALPPAGA
ncbi:MAG: hypothetical protein ACQSGP_11140 [Frankia sp.]